MAGGSLLGVSGEPLVYPVPLYVRNTFIDAPVDRQSSLEDFFEERKVKSCPTSAIEHLPLKELALLPLKELAPVRAVAFSPPTPAIEPSIVYPDTDSDLSTADTIEIREANQRSFGLAGDFGLPQVNAGSGKGSVIAGVQEQPYPPPTSAGSALHALGQCKPCAFFTTKGCGNGLQCPFCHLCDPGEKKRRRKEKLHIRTAVKQLVAAHFGLASGLLRSSSDGMEGTIESL